MAFGFPGTCVTRCDRFSRIVPPHSGHSRDSVVGIAGATVTPSRFLDKQRHRSYRSETPVSQHRFRFLHAERDAPSTTVAPRDCFADEIAIDFPSIDQFVPRVRDRFLGIHADVDTLLTEVSVSRREASRGTVVPVEVPLRSTCEQCGGRGETWSEPCLKCRGTGDWLVHHPVRVSVPAGVVHGARLRFRVNSPVAAPVRVEVRVAVRSSAA